MIYEVKVKEKPFSIPTSFQTIEEVKTAIEDITQYRSEIKFTYSQFGSYSGIYGTYINSPEDQADCGTMFSNQHLYGAFFNNPLEGEKYEYRLKETDPFYDEKEFSVATKNNMFYRPFELNGKKDDDIDDKSKVNVATLDNLYQRFEALLVVDFLKFEFLCDLALGNLEILEEKQQYLEKMAVFPSSDSIKIYKGLIELIGLQPLLKKWKETHSIQTETIILPSIKSLLGIMAIFTRIDNILIESIILLTHGLLHSGNMTQLSVKYNVSIDLIQALFISAFPTSIL